MRSCARLDPGGADSSGPAAHRRSLRSTLAPHSGGPRPQDPRHAGGDRRASGSWSPSCSATSSARRRSPSSLDPEEYRDLLEQYLELAFREIYRVEGIVNQLAGDGIMALFGAPVAHEDAPYRAVLAAWRIRGRARRLQPPSARAARARPAGAHRHPHRTGGRRHRRQRPQDGLHGHRRHDEPRRPAAVARRAGDDARQRVDTSAGPRLLRRVRADGPVRGARQAEPVIAYEVLGEHEPTTAIGARRGARPDAASSAAQRELAAARRLLRAGAGRLAAGRRRRRRAPAAASRGSSTSSSSGSRTSR